MSRDGGPFGYSPQMDHSTRSIAEFATRLTYADLPADLVHDCKRRIVDTIGCAIRSFSDARVKLWVSATAINASSCRKVTLMRGAGHYL